MERECINELRPASDHFSGFAPCDPLLGGQHEPTCRLEGLALKQMLFSPLTLLLGLLDPFFQTQNVTAGVQRLLREEKPRLH